jgi:hypothetical protein
MKINYDQWEALSDILLRETRFFNEMSEWKGYTTSYWRMLSDDVLREILEFLKIERERE